MYYDTAETGQRIKHLRKAEELTQEQMAEQVGVSARQVRAFESGQSGAAIDVLIILAELFDTSLDYLVLGKPTQADIRKKLDAMLQDLSEIMKTL